MLNDVALNHLERRGGREGDWERACTFGRTFLFNLAARLIMAKLAPDLSC